MTWEIWILVGAVAWLAIEVRALRRRRAEGRPELPGAPLVRRVQKLRR